MGISVFSKGVRISAARPGSAMAAALFEAEKVSTVGFTYRRLHEFATGRHCARMAMRALLHKPTAIPQHEDRSPLWPAGIVGSISHSSTWCVAAVGKVEDGYLSVGIDIEPLVPLPDGVEDTVLSETEQRWIAKQPGTERNLLGCLIFSAKECVYKCQYPLSRRLLDFQAIEISPDWAGRKYVARFIEDAPPFRKNDLLYGRFVIQNRHFICGAELRYRTTAGAVEADKPPSPGPTSRASMQKACPCP